MERKDFSFQLGIFTGEGKYNKEHADIRILIILCLYFSITFHMFYLNYSRH